MMMLMFGSCLGCNYHNAFGYDTIMPLRIVDLYIRCGWLGIECLGKFVLLFSSEDDSISGTYNILDSEWGRFQQRSGSAVISEWWVILSAEQQTWHDSEWRKIPSEK